MVMRFARRLVAATTAGATILFFILLFNNNNNNNNNNNSNNNIPEPRHDPVEFGKNAERELSSRENVREQGLDKTANTQNEKEHRHQNSSSSAAAPLLRILVLTYNRARSLSRCLDSINKAEYDGYPVELEIHVDRGRTGKVHNETLSVAEDFKFSHGVVHVHVQPRHAGVLGQWLSTWRVPRDNTSEIAVFVEDDLTLSPYFARWLRMVHQKYDTYPGISGYTLQDESIRHAVGAEDALLTGPPGEIVFVYPVVGSWGFSPNVAAWREFVRWYHDARIERKITPNVAGLKPSGWYVDLVRAGRADSMWTMWHIAHAYKNNLYTVYPNLPWGKTLAFNWKEPGEHYSGAVVGEGLRAHLLDTWRESDLRLPETLTVLDTYGEMTGQKLTATGLQ